MPSAPTLTVAGPETEGSKLPSPPYDAAIVCDPSVLYARVHVAVEAVPSGWLPHDLIVFPSSANRTDPVGLTDPC